MLQGKFMMIEKCIIVHKRMRWKIIIKIIFIGLSRSQVEIGLFSAQRVAGKTHSGGRFENN